MAARKIAKKRSTMSKNSAVSARKRKLNNEAVVKSRLKKKTELEQTRVEMDALEASNVLLAKLIKDAEDETKWLKSLLDKGVKSDPVSVKILKTPLQWQKDAKDAGFDWA